MLLGKQLLKKFRSNIWMKNLKLAVNKNTTKTTLLTIDFAITLRWRNNSLGINNAMADWDFLF